MMILALENYFNLVGCLEKVYVVDVYIVVSFSCHGVYNFSSHDEHFSYMLFIYERFYTLECLPSWDSLCE